MRVLLDQTGIARVLAMRAENVAVNETARTMGIGRSAVYKVIGGAEPSLPPPGKAFCDGILIDCPAADDFAELYAGRTYADNPRAAARVPRPITVSFAPQLPGAQGEAMS